MNATAPRLTSEPSLAPVIRTATEFLGISQLFDLLNEHHCLGAGRPAKHDLWQGVWERDPESGPDRLVAFFCWAGAAKRFKDRDEWIGWDSVTCAIWKRERSDRWAGMGEKAAAKGGSCGAPMDLIQPLAANLAETAFDFNDKSLHGRSKKRGLNRRPLGLPSRQSPVGLKGRLVADRLAVIRDSGGNGGWCCFAWSVLRMPFFG